MPRGDKSSYMGKQKRKAEHIEEGYEKRGVSKKEAESRAWATVNKEDKGGKKAARAGARNRARPARAKVDAKEAKLPRARRRNRNFAVALRPAFGPNPMLEQFF
jgi:hypothetical protein